MKHRIIRSSTVAMSLDTLLEGQLHYLNDSFEVLAVSGKNEQLMKVEVREKVRIANVPMCRKINLVADLVSLFRLYILFLRERPSIVHSITPKAGLLNMMAAKLARVPVRMHTFTGLIFPSKTGLFQNMLILIDRLLCACATTVYPEGEGVKQDLIHYRITRKPLKVIGNGNINGINSLYYHPDVITEQHKNKIMMQLGILDTDFVFVFVGRLVKDKGINELVNAFKQLQQRSGRIKLLLVGPFEPELDPVHQSTLHEIQNNPGIICIGFQEDVRPYYAVSHCLVFPSYREGFPNVPMQAGAMGLPSIVTDINGCNEIITHGYNGLIIPPKDINALEEAMYQIMKDKVLYQTLQSNARGSIVSRFDQLTLWKQIKEEYDKQLRIAGIC